jgi:1,5-anhydro-D-fructose reductase (1,5-anhydro-D-mannitol-forming)
MIRVGFIGFGAFALLRYNIIRKIDGVVVCGFFDPKLEKMDNDLVRFSSIESLLGAVDAVMISVPPFYAADYSYQALQHGVHVFCEKPPATDYDSLKKIHDLNSDLVLAYGFNHRLHDSVIQIKQILDRGDLGKILWMRGRYGKEVDANYLQNWRCNKRLNGGGILIDQGIHLLDIMNYFAGGFDVTQAILSDAYLNVEGVEDNAFINLMATKTKISASLHSTLTQWRYLFSLEIFLEQGSLVLNGLRTRSGNYGDETLFFRSRNATSSIADYTVEYNINNSWNREMDAFFNAIRGQSSYAFCGIREAQEIMLLMEKIYKTAIWM